MLARAGLFGVTQACYSVDDCCSVIIRATAWPSTARISATESFCAVCKLVTPTLSVKCENCVYMTKLGLLL